MGSISTHAEITRAVKAEMQQSMPNLDYYYLELGNFLTDVSQFRDPYSYVKLKFKIRDELNFIRSIISPAYLNVIFGNNATLPYDGALSRYFEKFIKGLTIQMASTMQQNIDETERIFTDNFTQYYPHEHVDFPPVNNFSLLRSSRRFQLTTDEVMPYLKDYIWYIAVELSKVEQRWKAIQANNRSAHEVHNILADLGNVLHSIEDFFFHSNFTEILYYNKKLNSTVALAPTLVRSGMSYNRIPRRSTNELLNGQLNRLFGSTLPLDNNFQRRLIYYKRKFFRRLRYPKYLNGGRQLSVSPRESLDGSRTVFTGGFGENDIFHTLFDALTGLESRFELPFNLPNGNQINIQAPWEGSGLVLFENILSNEKRERLRTDHAYFDSVENLHKQQLRNNEYQRLIRRNSHLSTHTKSLWIQAFDIDKDVSSMAFGQTPGVGGLLLNLVQRMQQEAHDNTSSLTRNHRILDYRTNNGASSDQIGNHTLMSKDTSNSQPFRKESLAMAKFVSSSIGSIMAQEWSENRNRRAIYWNGILNSFLKFPQYNQNGNWESILLDSTLNDQQISNSQLMQHIQIIHYPINNQQYQSTISSNKRQELEQRYRRLENAWRQRWYIETG